METTEPSNETPPVSFPPHCGTHLKSKTHRSLVRFVSHCYDQSEVSFDTNQIDPHQLSPDNCGDELEEATEKGISECGDLVSPDGGAGQATAGPESNEAVGVQDTKMVIDEKDHTMGTEENEDSSEQMETTVDGGTERLMNEVMVMNELIEIVTGKEDLVHDNNGNHVPTSLDKNKNGDGVVASVNNLEENDLQQIVVEESGGVGQLLGDKEHCDQKSNHDNNGSHVPASLDKNKNGDGVVALVNNLEENDLQQIVLEESGGAGQLLGDKEHCDQKSNHDNNGNHVPTSLDENKNGDGVAASVNNLEENGLQQIVMEESGGVGELLGDKEHCNQKISEAFDSSENKGMTNEVPKPSETSGDKSFSLKTNASEVQHEIQQEEIEQEKSICASGTVESPNDVSEEGEISGEEGEISGEEGEISGEEGEISGEEGEISGDDDVDDNSMDMVSEDIVVSKEKKVDGMQVSEDAISKKEFAFNEQSGVKAKDSEFNYSVVDPADNVNNSRKVELRGSVRNLVYYGEILEYSTDGNQGNTLEAKQEAGVCNKKMRGTPTAASKARKQLRKRRKVAEKNQQLGVKRLKLETVLKPKPVSICRHYLYGRCLEGDKCNFSHDAVPLTKSKPCSHFARHMCMKGDHCPFDHQLSNYPCNSFVAKGFCSRGRECLFSHKIPLKEDAPSASNASKVEFKPPSLLGNSNTKMQLNSSGISHRNIHASSKVGVFSSKNSEQNMAKTVLKPPSLAAKGIGSVSVGKSSVVGKIGNQTNPSASGTVQNMNEIPKKTPPAAAPKGINFLSFGKDSGFNIIARMKSSPLNNSVFKQDSSTSNGDDSVKIGNQTSQSASSTMQKSNEMLKKSQSAVPPQGIDSLSIGNALMNESRRNNQYGLPSSSNGDINRSVQESQNVSDKHLNSPWRLSASPLASGQSPDHLAGGYYKNTPNSAQKALMSTLAFAAKFESQRKINWTTVGAGVNKETGDSSESSQNDSVEASKILEFVSNPDSKTKQ